MSDGLRIEQIGPSVTVQDLGRPNYLAFGLSQGGAADVWAIAEGAALLQQPLDCAAIEMAGFGGTFKALKDLTIALTGAPMRVTLDGAPIIWNASHAITAGQSLSIGAATKGIYGYLHVAGGIATKSVLKSSSAHLAGGIGAPLAVGDHLPTAIPNQTVQAGMALPDIDRFSGGVIRVLSGVHTHLFTPETRARFETTPFHRNLRGNRQGAELTFEGEPFAIEDQLSILSEPMVPGDIQMTGAGTPFVLLPECQTIGGYPRIGTILPDDLPMVAQATPLVPLRFKLISHEEAMAQHTSIAKLSKQLRSQCYPLIRDPQKMHDLLHYQLISGAISGQEQD